METREYGHVRVTRVIADGDHGNVQAERVVPVIINSDPTPDEVMAAETGAWAAATEQVVEQINQLFERQWMPAPYHGGPRYDLCLWQPNAAILLIVPRGAHVPGLTHRYSHSLADGHRLASARAIAAYIVDTTLEITECWDFADGDFTELKHRLAKIKAEREHQLAKIKAEREERRAEIQEEQDDAEF